MPNSINPTGIPFNFLALPEEKSDLNKANVVIIPVPYDSTTSYRAGAREGPYAIIKASQSLEDYDHELDIDVSDIGIHTTHFVEPHMAGPQYMVERIKNTVQTIVSRDKIIGLLGGEHTITVGAVQAISERYSNISVLCLDAHGDLRNRYMNSLWSHATVSRRIQEICPLVQVGVRSISQEEKDFIQEKELPTFFWESISPVLPSIDILLRTLTQNVYISVDLDVLDPSIMSSVGTPEPGGMSWAQVTWLIKQISRQRRIVGFDVTELSPDDGPPACAYLAAKLVYKLISYSTFSPGHFPTAT